MRRWEEKDGGEDVEEVKDGGGKHQPVEVPFHNGAKGEVNQAAEISNQPKEANYHLPKKWKWNKLTVGDLKMASLNQGSCLFSRSEREILSSEEENSLMLSLFYFLF